ncbi:hypothetical protein IT575_05735 [bacterium]|nr:hypothetical protein [bacterium]
MDPMLQAEFQSLERRVRASTALILAMVSFGCTFGLMLLTSRELNTPQLFYPWLVGGLFYLAGELLGLVWFRVMTRQLMAMQEAQKRQLKAAASGQQGSNGVHLDAHQPVHDIEVVQA